MVFAIISEIGSAPHRRETMVTDALRHGARRIVLLKGVASYVDWQWRFTRPRRLFDEADAKRFFEQIPAVLTISGRPRLAGWFLIGESGNIYHLAPTDFVLESNKRYLLHPGSDTYILLDTSSREVCFLPAPIPPRPPLRHFRRARAHRPTPPKTPADPTRLIAPCFAISIIAAIFMALVIVTTRSTVDYPIYEIARADSETIETAPALAEPITETSEEAVESEVEIEIPLAMPSIPSVEAVVEQTKSERERSWQQVAQLHSPVVMPLNVGGTRAVGEIMNGGGTRAVGEQLRSHASREQCLRKFGGSGAGENCVLRALRYLKATQLADGSWQARGEGHATGFALLTLLAHGETTSSAEFGTTVRRALEYLMAHPHNPMATYALAEAATLIRTPLVTECASKAVGELCRRQKASVRANSGGIIYRYCAVMALKAAQAAQLPVDELELTQTNFRQAFRTMRDHGLAQDASQLGTKLWHYMIAAVCLQYLGAGDETATRQLISRLEHHWSPATLGESAVACCPVRSNYFATTIFFNHGEPLWSKWNRTMLLAYEHSQQPLGEGGVWRCHDKHIGDQPFWSTCYVAMQLMTYYRYHPTGESTSAAPTLHPPNAQHREPCLPEVDVEI